MAKASRANGGPAELLRRQVGVTSVDPWDSRIHRAGGALQDLELIGQARAKLDADICRHLHPPCGSPERGSGPPTR